MYSRQIEMISLEDLVSKDHTYRKFKDIWDFKSIQWRLNKLKKDNPHEGYGLKRLFLCCLLQFLEDLSDRELERFLRENNAAKWFCEFSLKDKTPDHTAFTRFRQRLGAETLSKIFAHLRSQLQAKGKMNEVFTFVDATHLIAKANLWEERDAAIKQKYEKLNNKTLPKVASDKQARIGCKGKSKFWYGYKKHLSVDMQSGLINKVAITPANLTDAQGLKHVCPSGGMLFADKGYCSRPAKVASSKRGCYLGAVKKNNMKGKNFDLDRWRTKMRTPFESVFSQQNKRTRYRGVAKNQFSAFMEAICFNLKRLVVLHAPPMTLT